MGIDPNTGYMDGVRLRHSPNHDARPEGAVVDLLVIHNISLPAGEFGTGYIDQLFMNLIAEDAPWSIRQHVSGPVSAHFVIDRKGEITQYVSVLNRAWHAGASSFGGRDACNDYSVGIELEGVDDQPYESIQYVQLLRVVNCLRKIYPAIGKDRIVGHNHIAPQRKTDPGEAFDWTYFLASLS